MFLTSIQKSNSKARRSRTFWLIFLFFTVIFFGSIEKGHAQTCTPSSAQICVAGDDTSTVYVGGVSLGIVNYCNWDGTGACPPGCLNVPVSLLTGSTVCLAIETQNTAPLINYSSWDLDITCVGGLHSEITSNNGGGLSLYYTPNGDPSPAPAPDGSGNPWYSPNYNPGSNPFTFTETAVNCAETWGKPIFDPVSGAQLVFQANACSADTAPGNSTGALFWRQCTPIPTPAPTLGPAAFTITKTLIGGPVYNVPGANDVSVTYAIQFCNTGAAVTTPVTIQDNISGGGMQYNTGCVPVTGQSQPFTPYCPGNGSLIYPIGIPGNWCQSVTFTYTNYYFPNSWCATFTNNAVIKAPVATATSASVTSTIVCPTNTFTFTPTYTFTPTFTFTPTPTWTHTPVPATRTSTPTFTNTPTYTPTPTWTNTFPPGTFTPTNTYTPTPTFTSTFTWTPTNTPVPGSCQIAPPKGQPGFVLWVKPAGLNTGLEIALLNHSANEDPLKGKSVPGPIACRLEDPAVADISKRITYARPI